MKTFITEKFLMPQLSREVFSLPQLRRTPRRARRNPVLAELHRASRRLRLVWKLWRIERCNAEAAKNLAYERARLKAEESNFCALLADNDKRSKALRLELMAINTEAP